MTDIRAIDGRPAQKLEAAEFALARIGGFSDRERKTIVGAIRMGGLRVAPGHEGWGPSLVALVDRAFTWSEFDQWHAFFTACGAFPERWDGLQVAPSANTPGDVRKKYGQRKLELLLEWLDRLSRRPAEFDHFTRRGRRAQIVRQDHDRRCSVCESFNGHAVGHQSDTMPPLHPGCRCVLMASISEPGLGQTAIPQKSGRAGSLP